MKRIKVFEASHNADNIEGRGPSVHDGYFVHEGDANRAARGKGVMGQGSAQAIVDEVTSIVLEEFVTAGIPREMQREEGRRERGPFQMYKDVEHLRIQNGGFPEVPTSLVAFYNGWTFERAWYYYRAKGDGIPPDIAEEFHQTWGRQVRVEGHCGCPSPLEWCQGFAVGSYHIDTPAGLKAFIELLDRVYKPQKRK